MFTLGHDRWTRARWMLPYLTADDGAGNGGGGGDQGGQPTGSDQHGNPAGQQGDDDRSDDQGKRGKAKDKDKDGDGFTPITSQDELDRIFARRLERLRRSIENDVRESVEQQARLDEAKKQGDYKTLYEAEKEKREALERDIADRERADKKRVIATKHGLPAEMASRLTGETDEELEADAKALAKLVKVPAPDDTDLGSTGNRRRRSGGRRKDDNGPDPRSPEAWGLPG